LGSTVLSVDVCVGLYKDDVVVAKGCFDDGESSQSLSAFYRETLAEDASFAVKITAEENFTVPA